MHVVECPQCARKFEVPSAVANRRMRCSRCGEEFVGSSVETPDAAPRRAAAPIVGGSVFHSTLEEEQARSRSSTAGIFMLVGGFFGLAAIVVFGMLIYHQVTNPRVLVKDPETGRIQQDRRMPMDEAQRLAQEMLRAESDRRRQSGATAPIGEGGEAKTFPDKPTDAAPAGQASGDPKLEVSRTLVPGGAVGDITYVCGRALSMYAEPLKSVTMTVYVNGAQGPSRTYAYVPGNGSVYYSISLGSQNVDEVDIRVIATCEVAHDRMVIWAIPSDDILRSFSDGKVVWSGRTRNNSPVPVKKVEVHCDFFASDGIQGGTAVGRLVKGDKIGIGKSAAFRIVSGDPTAETAELLVARVVAETY